MSRKQGRPAADASAAKGANASFRDQRQLSNTESREPIPETEFARRVREELNQGIDWRVEAWAKPKSRNEIPSLNLIEGLRRQRARRIAGVVGRLTPTKYEQGIRQFTRTAR